MIKETPHIKINEKTGQIDYTSARIIYFKNNAYVFSYNTVIGIYTQYTGKPLYLETAAAHSSTTSTKHKPRARRLAEYNSYKIIPDIKPEILHDLYLNSIKYDIAEIVKESQIYTAAIAAIKTGNEPETVRDIKPYLKPQYKQTKKDFKNGNQQIRSWYKLEFKYHAPIYYHINTHVFKETRPAYYGRTGYKPPATYNRYKKEVFFS